MASARMSKAVQGCSSLADQQLLYNFVIYTVNKVLKQAFGIALQILTQVEVTKNNPAKQC